MNFSAKGRVRGAGGCPRIGSRIVSPTGVVIISAVSAPHNHFAACPDCRVRVSASGCIGRADSSPSVRAGIISPAGVQEGAVVVSAPDDHFFAGPHCSVSEPGDGRIGGAGWSPTVCARIVSPASVQAVNAISGPAPDDYFTIGPHCGGEHSAIGRVRDAGGCPRVSAWRTAFRNIARALGPEKNQQCPRRQQKQVKRASNKMRSNGGATAPLHNPALQAPSLPGMARKCRDFSLP